MNKNKKLANMAMLVALAMNTGGYSQGNDPGGTQDGNPRYCSRSRSDQIRF